ncbi:MAG: type II toxin-antitoxin system VapC family toxin [Bacteroidales bacterium]|jgi:predicted nucleic acid-binding protein|nr:type II toxin-antitoxin system VapC family toxin [Bacteroidales bacterium]
MILLDTSILIEVFRKQKKEDTLFYKMRSRSDKFAISIITYYEILIGSNEKQIAHWLSFLKMVNVITLDISCANKAAEIYKSLKTKNKLIEVADMFIAATALSKGIPIATLNKKHFERIEGLEVI